MKITNRWLLAQLGFSSMGQAAIDLSMWDYVRCIWWRITGRVSKGKRT